MILQVDKMAQWQDGKLTNDNMTDWQPGSLQIDKMVSWPKANWQNGKLIKWPRPFMFNTLSISPNVVEIKLEYSQRLSGV